MGGKTTTTQGKTRPDPRIMKQYLALVRKASAAADKPYKEYNGELVADPTADQGRAYAAIRDMQGAYDGYYDNAAAAFDRAGRPITPIAFSETIAACLPPEQVEFQRFAGCGHGIIADDQEGALQAIRDFILA